MTIIWHIHYQYGTFITTPLFHISNTSILEAICFRSNMTYNLVRTYPNAPNQALILGMPATICPSMPHSLLPLLILKNPLSPQSSFHELATNQ